LVTHPSDGLQQQTSRGQHPGGSYMLQDSTLSHPGMAQQRQSVLVPQHNP
jgi:hypothetical protein